MYLQFFICVWKKKSVVAITTFLTYRLTTYLFFLYHFLCLHLFLSILCIKDCCLQGCGAFSHIKHTDISKQLPSTRLTSMTFYKTMNFRVTVVRKLKIMCNFLCLVNEQAIYISPHCHVCQVQCLFICKPWSMTATSTGEVLWLLPVCNFTLQSSQLKSRSDMCYILAPGLGFLTHADEL